VSRAPLDALELAGDDLSVIGVRNEREQPASLGHVRFGRRPVAGDQLRSGAHLVRSGKIPGQVEQLDPEPPVRLEVERL